MEDIEVNLLYQWAKHPSLLTDEDARKSFNEKFKHENDFKVKYKIIAYMFSNISDPEHQPWILNLANDITPESNQSRFRSTNTMVEFFIKNFSYGEVEELRHSIWSLIK